MTTPQTRTVDQIDDFFGTAVADPYRWMEDDRDPEVEEWLAGQAVAARAYLDALPGREIIAERLDALAALPRSSAPRRRGRNWFRLTNDGVQQQDVLRVATSPVGDGRVLIDPNTVAEDASVSLAGADPSPDGELVAYAYAEAGSDWRTWRVRRVSDGADLDDVVPWSKFTSATWLPDSSGFVYGAFDAPVAGHELTGANRGHRLMLHRIGTPPQTDQVVIAAPDEPDLTFWATVTDDERWLVVSASAGTDHRIRLWVRDLADPESALRPLIERAEASWDVIGSAGTSLLAITDLDAPSGRLVGLDTATGAVTELVPEQDGTLEQGVQAGGRILLNRLRDAASELTVHSADGRELTTVELPGLGSVVEIQASAEDSLLHLGYTSFTSPAVVLAHDLDTGVTEQVAGPSIDSADLVTDQVWITSADGTRLPMFVIHRRDVTAGTGPHPALLYGYGGFRISLTPAFNMTRFAFARAGGVVAIPSPAGRG